MCQSEAVCNNLTCTRLVFGVMPDGKDNCEVMPEGKDNREVIPEGWINVKSSIRVSERSMLQQYSLLAPRAKPHTRR